MTTTRIETNRDTLQAERQRLKRLLTFCADDETRTTYDRRVSEIGVILDDVHAIARIAQPRAEVFRYDSA